MKTSDQEKRKLCMEWRLLAEDWRKQALSEKPLSSDKPGGRLYTKRERLAMSECIIDCASELEAMLANVASSANSKKGGSR